MNKNNELLALMGSGFFDGFTESECENLLACIKPVRKYFIRKEILAGQGECVEYVAIILAGKGKSTK